MYRRVTAILAFVLLMAGVTASFAFASTGTIIPPHQYAWNDNGGYVNWDATSSNVIVSDTVLMGYIWSAGFGWINLAPSNGGVINSAGVLSGYAWSTNTGYINFSGVTIDSNGQFHGHTVAQPTFGTMTFDCTNCDVATSWHAPVSSSGGGGAVSGGGGGGGNGQIINSALSAPYASTSTISTSTQSSILIASLQAQIQSLTAELATLTAAHTKSSTSTTFNHNLQLSETSTDVKALQQYLNNHGFPVASAGAGSPGNETTYFGSATFRALKKFQAANGILVTGYFGPLTRAFVNSH